MGKDPVPALGLRQQGHSDTLCHVLLALPTALGYPVPFSTTKGHHVCSSHCEKSTQSSAATRPVSCQPEGAASWGLQRPIPIAWDVQILWGGKKNPNQKTTVHSVP